MSNSGPPSNYGAVRKRSRDRFENSNQGQSYHRQDSYDYSAPPYPERRSDDYRNNWGDRSQHQQDYPYHSTQYDYRLVFVIEIIKN